MARTYRRETASAPDLTYAAEYKKKPVMRVLHRWFGDNPRGTWTPPARYSRELDKTKTAREKQELHRALVDPDYELLSPRRFKDAAWNYW